MGKIQKIGIFKVIKPYLLRNPRIFRLAVSWGSCYLVLPYTSFQLWCICSRQGTTSDICHIRHRLRRSENAALKSLAPCKSFLAEEFITYKPSVKERNHRDKRERHIFMQKWLVIISWNKNALDILLSRSWHPLEYDLHLAICFFRV